MSNVLRLTKDAFTWSVVVTTILWSMGVAALVPLTVSAAACPTLNAGDLFKVPNNSAVYLVNPDMKRMYFPNGEVYKTWYADFSGVQTIDNTCVDNYPSGGGVNFRPGSRLIKTVISPNVYAVGPNNMKHKIASEEVAKALYGANWASLVRDLPDVFDANYAVGSAISSSEPHNGQLVKKAGDSKTYKVMDGELHMVDGSLASFLSADVRELSSAVFAAVEDSGDSATAGSITNNPSQKAGGSSSSNPSSPSSSTGTLTVALAADTPSGTYAEQGAARVPFTKINFTATGGDVTIDGMRVTRAGSPATDSDFSKINIVDSNNTLVDSLGKTLNSDSYVNFGKDITIPAGTTKSYTLVADMASSGVSSGSVPKLQLTSIDTDATVVGSLPIAGNAVQTSAVLTLATATLSQGQSIGTPTEQVGDTGIHFASIKVGTVSNEDVQMGQFRLYNGGSSDNDDVQNWKMTYNSNTVATGVLKDKYLTFDLSSCGTACEIEKGKEKTFQIYGDIVDGSTRTVNLYVRRATDVLIKDKKNNFWITPTNSAADANLSNTITISQGKLTVSKTNDVQAGNIPDNSSDVALGSWNFKVQGEPITINTLVIRATASASGDTANYDNLVLYDANGKALTSGVDFDASATIGYVTSTDSFTLPVGDNILTAKATVATAAQADDTVLLAIDMRNTTNFEAEGADSAETITLNTYALPNSVVSANTMTVKSHSLLISTLATPAARTLAAGSSDVEVAHILLDASESSEDVKVTQMVLTDDVDSGTGLPIDMANIRLYVDKDGDDNNGSGTRTVLNETKAGSTGTAADETFTFNLSGDDQFVVKAGKSVKVIVKVDIAGGATAGTHRFMCAETGASVDNCVSATGVTSGDTVTESNSGTAADGQQLTVGSAGGTVQVSLDPSNPNAALFAAGAQGVTLATYNFLATTTEDVEIERITLTSATTDASSSTLSLYSRLYLVDEDGTTVGSTVPTSTSVNTGRPVINLNDGAFVVPISDTDGKKLHLKADFASIGAQEVVTQGGYRSGFSIAAAAHIQGKGDLTGTGSVEYLGSTAPTGKTHIVFKSVPTVTKLSVGSILSNGTIDLYKFKVTAGSGDIGLAKFVFGITTTSVNVTDINLYDITDTNSEVRLYTDAESTGNYHHVQATLNENSGEVGTTGTKEVTVASGSSRTFVLRGTVTGASSGDSIQTVMAGDSAGMVNSNVLMDKVSDVDVDTNDDFIWSDRSATGHATTTDDWANGYLVSGLNSASSTASVVSL